MVQIVEFAILLYVSGHIIFHRKLSYSQGLENHENYTFIDVSFSYKYFSGKEQTDENVNLQRQLSKWDIPVVFKPFADIARKQLISDQYLQFEQ